MKLSVIIPVYNVEKYISRCLESLISQDLSIDDYEVLIISDGSKDNSEKIARTYCEAHSNIYLFVQENSGVGSARNNGLNRAKGDYIYFLDPDDYLVSNVLGKLIKTSQKNNLDILSFRSITFTESSSESSLDNNSKSSHNENVLSHIKTGIEYISKIKYDNEIWWYFIKREFVNAIDLKFIEGRWMEDAIFTVNLFLKAKRTAHLNLDVHRYRVSPGTAMTSREPSHYLKVIRDNQNAATVFGPLIEAMEKRNINFVALKRIKARQQSFVFFLMVRMLQSTIDLEEVKFILNDMKNVGAYPLDSFLGKDYNKLSYYILVPVFNKRSLFYLLFKISRFLFSRK